LLPNDAQHASFLILFLFLIRIRILIIIIIIIIIVIVILINININILIIILLLLFPYKKYNSNSLLLLAPLLVLKTSMFPFPALGCCIIFDPLIVETYTHFKSTPHHHKGIQAYRPPDLQAFMIILIWGSQTNITSNAEMQQEVKMLRLSRASSPDE
jgi:hypothetical protein